MTQVPWQARQSNHPIILVNPAANRGRTSSLVASIEALCRDLHSDAEVKLTGSSATARGAVQAALEEGRGPIIACGGDGTVHEIATTMLEAGARVPLGIVPAGSGNDYAFHALGLPRDLPSALRVALQGRAVPVDAARVNGAYMINAFGAGIDANVAWNVRDVVEAGNTRVRGELLYTVSAVKQILRHYHDLPWLHITVDGQALHPQRMLLAAVMLGPTTGGGYRLAPGADPHDGLLDVLLARHMPRAKAFVALPLAKAGRHLGLREVRLARAHHVHIRSEVPVKAHLDGELLTDREFDIRILPGALTVMRPEA